MENNDKKATFKEVLGKNKSVSIHTRNLQILDIDFANTW